MAAVSEVRKEGPGSTSTHVSAVLRRPQDIEQAGQSIHKHQSPHEWAKHPSNPYTWPTARKITIIVIVSLSHLATTMSASMMAASLEQISDELHMDPATTLMASSIFLLGLGFGPFIVGPMSELYGRRPVWLLCNLWYLVWNTLCPIGRSAGMLIAGRLLAGFGASCGIGLLGPVSADLYGAADRGKSIAIATFLPYIGPALGPIVGGLASEHIHWSWTFWILSAFNALATTAGFFWLKESYGPLLRQRNGFSPSSERAVNNNNNNNNTDENNNNTDENNNNTDENNNNTDENNFSHTLYHTNIKTSRKIRNNLLRPVKMLIFRPVILFVSINMALDFAVYFLVLSTFATLWIDEYSQSQSESSLHYIAITLGAMAATQVGGRLMDRTYKNLSAREQERAAGEIGRGQVDDNIASPSPPPPEVRIVFLIPSIVLTPVALLFYAWSSEYRLHWAVVDVSICLFTFSNFMFSAGFQAYLLDEFSGGGGGVGGGDMAASATAATKLLSYMLAFMFPLFAPRLYTVLGYGWGGSLLALVFAVVAVPSGILAWLWGSRLRAMGRRRTEE